MSGGDLPVLRSMQAEAMTTCLRNEWPSGSVVLGLGWAEKGMELIAGKSSIDREPTAFLQLPLRCFPVALLKPMGPSKHPIP